MPIGPFQSTVPRRGELVGVDRRGLGTDVEALPPVGDRAGGHDRGSRRRRSTSRAIDDVGRDLAPARSRAGGGTRRPCRARTSESPTRVPCASRNVNAIAPPTSTVSQRSSSASITPSLSLDLGAAEHRDERSLRLVEQAARAPRPRGRAAARRRAGSDARRADDRRVRAVRRAERLVHVDVGELGEVGARTRGRSRSRPARSAGSRACTHVARARRTRPAARTRGPTTAGASSTSRPSSSPRRAATGAIEYCGSGFALRAARGARTHDDRVVARAAS